MAKQDASVAAELFYDLCPNDPRCKAYFKLRTATQARVMHGLLNAVITFAGGNSFPTGLRLLQTWQDLQILLPVVNGHPFLTEADAAVFIQQRVEQMALGFANPPDVGSGTPLCPNCVPKGDTHESVRTVPIILQGAQATVDFPIHGGRRIVVPVFLRIRVMTPFDALKRGKNRMGAMSGMRGSRSTERDVVITPKRGEKKSTKKLTKKPMKKMRRTARSKSMSS